jgi:M6 family metalloprotease-like protein
VEISRGFLLIGTLFILAGKVCAGETVGEGRLCGTASGAVASLDEVGGIHMTARGTLRVLIVFVSFPDDTTSHPFWPAHNPPMSMAQFIDPDTATKSRGPFNLTNYFNEMSLGQFHLIGDAIWVESLHSQEEYRNGSFYRANWSVLQESVDPLVDFSQYDAWTSESPYHHVNAPDGQVDMIIMVWRTTMFEFIGEASLGYRAGFQADGKRIEMGFPEKIASPLGSGVTCEYPYGDTPSRLMRTIVHELGHWLLGGAHPYNGLMLSGKHTYWGILCDGQRVSSCANAYERERLGWITVPDIQTDRDISLPDFLTSGVAYKYHPPNGDPFEYFTIENHQLLSVFDDVTANRLDKGVWILHQQGPYMEMDNVRIKPSDGNWKWESPGVVSTCFSQPLPVFRRGTPKVLAGVSHRDQIPTPSSDVNWMYVYQDPSGRLNCGSFFAGQMFRGAFTAASGVFSPYSNPSSDTWANQPTPFSLEVINEIDGVATVRCAADPLDASPARRYLGADPSVQESQQGSLSLAWGAEWSEGQQLEADVNWSELERQIGEGGEKTTVYQGPATRWKDSSLKYDTSGSVPVSFRVRVRDTQGKYSVWSDLFCAAAAAVDGVVRQTGEPGNAPIRFALEANYPNPFNSATTILFALPEPSAVQLSIYDVLGRDVRRLLDAPLARGTYTVTWDGADEAGARVPSGVYLYRLTTGSFSASRKMLMVR